MISPNETEMQLMKQKQIFISYKSEEFDEALWVKESLEAQGFTCWIIKLCRY